MAVEIITKEDLQEFKNEIIQEIRNIIPSTPKPQKQWLRSADVKAILKISSSTLQTLRINGTLNHTKIGGTYFYRYDDIEKLLISK